MTAPIQQSFVNSRSQSLCSVSYRAPGRPRAVLIWHHGYGEHQGRYLAVHQFWAAAGISVFGFDAHGHGRSEPKAARDRALVLNYQHLVDDAVQFAQQVKQEAPAGTPVFLGGQSLGGLVSTLVALQEQAPWSGLVLTSAAMDVEWTTVLRLQRPFASLLARLAPRAQLVPAASPKDLSPDPAVVKAFLEDDLNFKGKVRTRTAAEILQGFGAARSLRARLSLPVFAHHGTADRITSRPAVQEFVGAIASRDKTLRLVEGGWHELLMGADFKPHAQIIADWILQHCPSARL